MGDNWWTNSIDGGKMKLNHIGVATKNIEVTTHLLEYFGYCADEVMWDENQQVNVRFLHSDYAPTIELLCSGEEDSPIDKIVEKNGTCVYHLCFETDNIDFTIEELRKQYYIPTGRKKKSLIDNGEVIFLYHTDNVMIELLEVK